MHVSVNSALDALGPSPDTKAALDQTRLESGRIHLCAYLMGILTRR